MLSYAPEHVMLTKQNNDSKFTDTLCLQNKTKQTKLEGKNGKLQKEKWKLKSDKTKRKRAKIKNKKGQNCKKRTKLKKLACVRAYAGAESGEVEEQWCGGWGFCLV